MEGLREQMLSVICWNFCLTCCSSEAHMHLWCVGVSGILVSVWKGALSEWELSRDYPQHALCSWKAAFFL